MSRYTHVTDELLSAYLDDAVTDSERLLVETAVADDPEVAWRLATLQHTVNLLGRLPDISLPRSFALTEAMIAGPVAETAGSGIPAPVSPPHPATEPEKAGSWEAWRSFWQGGNILIRNAAAASFAAFLVLAVGGAMITSQSAQQSQQVNFAPTAALPQAILDQASIDMDKSARSDLRPQEASNARAMESAQTEPIPLPAAAAGEVDEMAIAVGDESAAPPVVERTLAAPIEQSDAAAPPPVAEDVTVEEMAVEGVTAEEVVITEPGITATGVGAESEPITVAAVTLAEAPEAETAVVEDDNEPDAAPEAMAAITSADDETSATSTTSDPAQRAAMAESQKVEEPAQKEAAEEASAAETILSETPVSENRDGSPATINTDDAAIPDSTTEDEPAAEETPGEAVAMQAEAAPAGEVELAGPPSSVQGQGLTTTSASVTNIVQSDPIFFVQMIALALTLFFAVLWLLSRRTQSTSH